MDRPGKAAVFGQPSAADQVDGDPRGRAAAEWVEKLAAGSRFAESTNGLLETAQLLDLLYGRPAPARAQAKAAALFSV